MSDAHTRASASASAAWVVALGAHTPVGVSAYPTAAAVRAGIARVGEHGTMVDRDGDPFVVAMDRSIADTDRRARMWALGANALEEVLSQHPGLQDRTRGSLPVTAFIGLPEPGPHFTRQHASQLSERWREHFSARYQLEIELVLEGAAAGIAALTRALERIRQQPDACCIVGGVDSFIDADVLEHLDVTGRLASPSNRWGFSPGEGAGMLLVCAPGHAQRHGLRRLAGIAGVATSVEQSPINTQTICVGLGLASAMRSASSGCSPITRQFCDLNGERYREHEFSYAALRVRPELFENVIDYVAPTDCWGDMGAATAPLLALLPIAWHARGAPPGAWPMIWCGSDGGLRGAAVFHLQERSA